jgi:HAD superfamily hydrolase (TIGR01509 family)
MRMRMTGCTLPTMDGYSIDFHSLVGHWRAALAAADSALLPGSTGLPLDEVRRRRQLLAEERAATVRLLESYARDLHVNPLFARLLAERTTGKRLLGLPRDAEACVFNLDGVLVASAALHARAWSETLDEFIYRRIERTGGAFAPFDPRADYWEHIHARPRLEGVRGFLASRGVSLPEGSPDDPPGAETVHGLANRKLHALIRRLDGGDVDAFAGARLYLELAHEAGLQCAVVSASANTDTVLERAHLTSLVDERIDGNTMAAEHLRSKPATDTLTAACRHLGVAPERAVVFEATSAGVAAGRAGGFELVVGVAAAGAADTLRAKGADLVVADLGEIVEQRLAA